jgi:aminoglycoside 3-N-acetyltransferase
MHENELSKLINDLERLGVKQGDRVFIHSSFKSLGFTDGTTPADLVEALKELIGSEGTIGMPVFTFSFTPEKIFVPNTSSSTTGAISEAFRKASGVTRSSHPSHSVAFWGKDAEYYASSHYGIPPFDMSGPFGKLYVGDFKILMLGCGLAPNSMLHAIEDWAGLPYIIDSATTCYSSFLQGISDGGLRYPHMPLYHRDFYQKREESLKTKYAVLLKRHNVIVSGKAGNADAHLMRCRDLVDTCMTELDKHPDLFLCDEKKCSSCYFNKYELGTWQKKGGTGWGQIWAGAAKTCITSGIGTYSNQGWGKGVPCEGVQDNIYGRVIVFRKKAEYFALISLDVCLVELEVSDLFKKAVYEKTRIEPDNVIICATHTHYSPMVGAKRVWAESRDEAYVGHLAAKISGCVYEALKNTEPVSAASYNTDVDIGNINRRIKMQDGSFRDYSSGDATCPKPNGPASKEFSMIFFKSRSGKIKAGIGHYACHPVFSPYISKKISGDYPGIFSTTAENELGNDAVIAFIQGACGDQMPLKYNNSYNDAVNAGKKLAYAFLSKSLDAKFEPFKNISLKSKLHKIANTDDDIVTLIQVFAVNKKIVAFGSSEIFYEFVDIFRKKLKSKNAILAGYIDGLTYLPTKDAFEHSTYEIEMCRKVIKGKPGIGEEIIDVCVELSQEILNK